MIVPDEIKNSLQTLSDVSIGNGSIDFIDIESLERSLNSIDAINNSLQNEQLLNWSSDWVAIGFDELGDPICVDLSSPEMCVLSIPPSGAGEPFIIADSLNNFCVIIRLLKRISKGREYPVELERNPISKQDEQIFINGINDQNPLADIHFWKRFFEK